MRAKRPGERDARIRRRRRPSPRKTRTGKARSPSSRQIQMSGTCRITIRYTYGDHRFGDIIRRSFIPASMSVLDFSRASISVSISADGAAGDGVVGDGDPTGIGGRYLHRPFFLPSLRFRTFPWRGPLGRFGVGARSGTPARRAVRQSRGGRTVWKPRRNRGIPWRRGWRISRRCGWFPGVHRARRLSNGSEIRGFEQRG